MTNPLKILLGIVVLFASSTLVGQDIEEQSYLDQVFKETRKKKDASYVRDLTPVDKDSFKAEVKTMRGDLRMTGEYVVHSHQLLEHGKFIYFYDNGNIESQGFYEKGIKVGSWERYAADGTRRPDRYYNPESAEFLRDVMAGE